jgi:hypothetical protein
MFMVNVIAAPPELAAVVPVPPAVVPGAAEPGVVETDAVVPPVVPAVVPPVVAFELVESLPQDTATNARPTAIAA